MRPAQSQRHPTAHSGGIELAARPTSNRPRSDVGRARRPEPKWCRKILPAPTRAAPTRAAPTRAAWCLPAGSISGFDFFDRKLTPCAGGPAAAAIRPRHASWQGRPMGSGTGIRERDNATMLQCDNRVSGERKQIRCVSRRLNRRISDTKCPMTKGRSRQCRQRIPSGGSRIAAQQPSVACSHCGDVAFPISRPLRNGLSLSAAANRVDGTHPRWDAGGRILFVRRRRRVQLALNRCPARPKLSCFAVLSEPSPRWGKQWELLCPRLIRPRNRN